MLWWLAQTTLIAGALTVVAIAAGRWTRLGPEARHALWLLVLIKLAVPPFVAWPWSLPDAWASNVAVEVAAPVQRPEPGVVVAMHPTPEPIALPALPDLSPSLAPEPTFDEVPAVASSLVEAPVSALPDPGPTPRPLEPEITNGKPWIWDGNNAVLALWLAGSLVVATRRAVKVLRFHRSLSDAQPAPDWLIEETRLIAEQAGVRLPPVVTTDRVATPLLWCLTGPRLVLPEALVKRLEADRWPGILAHELAHLARGDHWVARLELLVEAAWWWNPLFWLTRRRLHEEAELACDARVVRSWPERRYAYAEALVDVCEHIARSASTPSPALGVGGAGATQTLEGRLNMILQEPTSRRSSRWVALPALLLAALALPAWTLGQQPEPPRPEQTPLATPKPDPAPVSSPSPSPEKFPDSKLADTRQGAVTSATIVEITKTRFDLVRDLSSLSFRYVVSGRDFSRPYVPRVGMGGGMGGMMGGGGGGMGGIGGGSPGGMGGMMGGGGVVRPTNPTTRRFVQVADVLLDSLNPRFRYDVLSARPVNPQEASKPPGWDRRFVSKNEVSYLTLESAWDKTGPVPFRWLEGTDRSGAPGDSLAALFDARSTPTGVDRVVDPLNPRPANMLDLAGSTLLILDFNHAKAEVVGSEVMDGHEVTRVAWIANGDIGLRGLIWFAPKLGDAVVYSVATMDPMGGLPGRRSWRKRSSDFEAVGQAWLPRKVTYEEIEADPAGGEPIHRRERDITFEDFRADPKPTPDAFRPKLAIQAIDDASGNFTANPPEIAPGLVDRLKRAVLESKFGPPRVEVTVDDAIAKLASTPSTQPPTAVKPGGRVYADIVTNVDEAPTGRLIVKDAAKPPPQAADVVELKPRPAAPPSGLEITAEAEKDAIDARVERMFKQDPEVVALSAKMKQATTKIEKIRTLVALPNDPAELAAKRELSRLMKEWDQLWETKSLQFREQIDQADGNREPIQVLQARRDGKFAEVRKAEAQRELAKAVLARNANLRARGPNFISNEEFVKGQSEWLTADAEVAIRKAAFDEAEAYLNQARRRLGIAIPEKTAAPIAPAEPKRPAEARPNGELGETGEGRRPPSQDELRDAVEVLEVQLQGKQAQLRAAESVASLSRRELDQVKSLAARKGVSEREVGLYSDKADTAQAEAEAKQAEVQELEVRLKHARRRVETNEATLKREVERTKARLDWSENMYKKGSVSKETYESDRLKYLDLMIQLDPKFIPPAPASPGPEAPVPAAQPK